MGTSRSKFNKANFKRGIRGYRQMFASLHLEQKELKKLWIEFGKIDTDNGGTVSIRELLCHCDLDFTPFAYRLFSIFDEDNSGAVDFREFVLSTWNCCTMDQTSLIRFAFDLFDGDHSGAIETKEMEAMLREIYGESFIVSPTAALTLKRVKALSSHSEANTPAKEATAVPMTAAKDGLQLDADGRVYALSFEAFREFCRQHAGMLLPAFTLQRQIRSKIVSESFWKGCSDRRNGGRKGAGAGKGKKRNRQPINLDELSTMIRCHETSGTGTTTDQETAAKNGPTLLGSAATTTTPDHGCAEPAPKQPPATASPSPAPVSLRTTPAGDGGRGERADGTQPPEEEASSSPAAPTTTAVQEEGNRKEDGNSENQQPAAGARAKKRRSDPQREGGEKSHKKGGGDAGAPGKRGSGTRGVVAVEEADGRVEGRDRADEEEAGTCAPPEKKLPRFSMPASSNGKLASHGNAAQPEVLLLKTDVQTDEPAKRIPRQSYPVPIGAGGRGVSAWARGGDAGRDAESDLPHFHGVANNRGNRESKVDSPALAAARAAAVYDLPALRETGANKRSSHQARDLVAGGGARGGGRAHRSSARPLSASPDARHRRRETGQAAAAASAAAKSSAAAGSSSPGGHHDPAPRKTPPPPDTSRENVVHNAVEPDHRHHHHHHQRGSHHPPERGEKRTSHN